MPAARQQQRRRQANIGFSINDHVDILTEVLKRLDGRSLCVAACVCRLWSSIVRNDEIWEELCFRHVSPRPSSGVRPVVGALGGYKQLYMVYIRPVFKVGSAEVVRRPVWTADEVQLYLSLFCVDYYERIGGRSIGGSGSDKSTSSSSLSSTPVNV
ncbi:F-box protein SNE [Linum perenne]